MAALAARLGRMLGRRARQACASLRDTAWNEHEVQLLVTGLYGARLLRARSGFDLQHALHTLGPREAWLHATLARADHADVPGAVRALVDDVVVLLSDPSLDTPGEDLDLLTFYEPFLQAYAPAERRMRGVYFTPRALAAYAVRRVDEVLEGELGIAGGLAADAADPSAPRVLDPAAGVGAFLSVVTEHVHTKLLARHRAQGLDAHASKQAWIQHVREALLPRLAGFEVMPAAHALLCLQLRIVLARTGFELTSDDVLDLHAVDALRLLSGGVDAPRAYAALMAATVIVGNPPYARGGVAPDAFWERELAVYKDAVRGEKNLQPLADDYLRFVRLTEHVLARGPTGVAALVVNSTLLHGHLHRGVRASLTQSFPHLEVLDLGGGSKRQARDTERARDESLFAIAQGVALLVMRRGGALEVPVSQHTALRGRRLDKLRSLEGFSANDRRALERATPDAPLVPRAANPPEYAGWTALDELFGWHSIAAKPGDDSALVAFEAEALVPRLQRLRASLRADAGLARTEALRRLRNHAGELSASRVARYAYRPFDTRFVYDDADLWTRPVRRLRERVDGQRLLLTSRFAHDAPFAHAFATRLLPDVIFLSSKSAVNCFAFPEGELRPALARSALGFEPERAQAFAYVYAWLHVPAFRARYAGALEQGFARVAWPLDRSVFEAMAERGQQLLALHLGETELTPWPVATLPRPTDIARARVIDGIPREASTFRVGGHQVCHKWLLDRVRAGRAFEREDLARYGLVVQGALSTLQLMNDLDAMLEQAGGFTAFA